MLKFIRSIKKTPTDTNAGKRELPLAEHSDSALPLPPVPPVKNDAYARILRSCKESPSIIAAGIRYETVVTLIDDAPASASAASPAPRVSSASPAASAARHAAAAPASAPIAASEKTAASSDQEQILSPMPGTVLSVFVQAGSQVKAGDVLLCFEAMKMENEILSPRDATVASVCVSKGTLLETGDLLCILR